MLGAANTCIQRTMVCPAALVRAVCCTCSVLASTWCQPGGWCCMTYCGIPCTTNRCARRGRGGGARWTEDACGVVQGQDACVDACSGQIAVAWCGLQHTTGQVSSDDCRVLLSMSGNESTAHVLCVQSSSLHPSDVPPHFPCSPVLILPHAPLCVQAISRVWRYGQERPTFIYHLVYAGTFETRVFERVLYKEELFQRVRVGDCGAGLGVGREGGG